MLRATAVLGSIVRIRVASALLAAMAIGSLVVVDGSSGIASAPDPASTLPHVSCPGPIATSGVAACVVAAPDGTFLELLVDHRGLVAYRVARSSSPDPVAWSAPWEDPGPRAAFWSGSWWTVVESVDLVPARRADIDGFRFGDVTAVAAGDVTGDGRDEVVVSFRRPFRSTPLTELRPDHRWWDAEGRSAHLGVYRLPGLDEVWVAGTLVRPIADVAVCDGGLAVAYSSLDGSAGLTAGVLTWSGFGFDASPDLTDPAVLGCTDLDGDGSSEPLVLRR